MSNDSCEMEIYYKTQVDDIKIKKQTTEKLLDKCLNMGGGHECGVFSNEIKALSDQIHRSQRLLEEKRDQCLVYQKYL